MIPGIHVRALLLAAVAVLAAARATAPSGGDPGQMDDQAGRVGLEVNHWVFTLIATSLELKGGKTLGAASLVLRFNH